MMESGIPYGWYARERQLAAAFRKILGGDAPCDDCPKRIACKSSRLACETFDKFVTLGWYNESAARQPNRATYRRIFDATDVVELEPPAIATVALAAEDG